MPTLCLRDVNSYTNTQEIQDGDIKQSFHFSKKETGSLW